MKLLIHVMLLTLSLPSTAAAVQVIDWPDDRFEIDVRSEYRSIVADTTSPTCHPDDGVAIAGLWIQLRQESQTTEENDDETESSPLDSMQVAHFIGFLEGRLRTSVPVWWSDKLSQARVRDTGLLETPFVPKLDTESYAEQFDLHYPKGSTIRRDENGLVVVTDRGEYNVSTEALNALDEIVTTKAISFVDVDADHYAILFSNDRPTRSAIWMFRKSDGKVVWQQRVWGYFRVGGGVGRLHITELVNTESHLIVFGSSVGSLYIESFEKQTGTCAFRFSTWY